MRLLILSMICAAVLAPMAGAALPGYGGVITQAKGATLKADKKKKKKKKAIRYINLAALHASLPGSHLYDDECLLARAGDCDVMFFADDEQRVKFIFVRVAPHVKKAKRKAAVNAVKQRLLTAYDEPALQTKLQSESGNAALLCYESISGSDDEEVLAESRWDALRNLYVAFDDAEPVLQDAEGLACAFTVEKDGVELEYAIDLAASEVDYVELRGGKVQNKGKINPEEVVKSMFSDLEDEPERDCATFGKGGNRLRTLCCDDTHFLTRNSRFFAAGTEDALRKAAERGANFKKYGFESPDFSAWQVTLPSTPVSATLLNAPGKDDADKGEPEEPKKGPEIIPEGVPDVQPPAEQDTPAQPEQPQETPTTAEPLTPEAARDAYRKMLREM